jgi:two-component system OmpR family sensor kinase
MSLRARLLVATLALVFAGLMVADVATYGFLRSFLVDRLDQQIEGAITGPPDRGSLPVGAYIEVRDPNGRVLQHSGSFFEPPPSFNIRAPLPGEVGNSSPDDPSRLLTVSAGGRPYRVGASALPGGGTFLVAVPMSDVFSTLHRLLLVEALVSLVVLAGVGFLAWWLVRIGLRPLEQMGQTARSIAGGDLSRRVEPATQTTEVGRLGLALNAMLAQIESAFEVRRRSEERLRRFVGDASHELRTPLTSIRGYAELFRFGAAERPEDLARAMGRIEQEAERMGVLVDDLLLLARLDQGRPLAREPVELATLARDAVADARAVEPDRPIDLVAPEALEVIGDEGRLRQVVGNLLSNVRTHTPPGTPAHVSLQREGDEAVFEVRDEGPGMSPDDAGRAFERFYRADPSRTRQSGGTGLGLSIVSAIIEAHGGRVAVESHLGRGTTFRAFLPVSNTSLIPSTASSHTGLTRQGHPDGMTA